MPTDTPKPRPFFDKKDSAAKPFLTVGEIVTLMGLDQQGEFSVMERDKAKMRITRNLLFWIVLAILGTLVAVIFVWLHGRPDPPAVPTPEAVSLYRDMLSAHTDDSIKFYNAIVSQGLFPAMTGIVAYLYAQNQAGKTPS